MVPTLPDDVFGQLRLGGSFFWAGVSTVGQQPRLWPYVFLPAILTLGALVGAITCTWMAFDLVAGWLWQPGPQATALQLALAFGLRWTLRLLAVFVLSLGAYLVAGLVAVPFNDRLSEEIERQIVGPRTDEADLWVWMGDLWMSFRHTLAALVLWLVAMLGLTLLQLVPGLGTALGSLASVVVSTLLLARELMDGCMSRRRYGFRHKLHIVRANLWLCIGLGFSAWLCMWIPGLNFVVLPMAVAGGTHMFCWMEQQALIPAADGATLPPSTSDLA